MNFPSFTLSQLLALMVFVASMLTLRSVLVSDQIVWRRGTLKYAMPSIPDDFQDNGRPPPKFALPHIRVSCENGRQLYLQGHLAGWESCRENFYHSKKRSFTSTFEGLDPNEWSPFHYYRAVGHGYEECERQIQPLLNEYSNAKVRSKLGYPSKRLAIPLLIVAHFSLLAVLALCPRKRNAK